MTSQGRPRTVQVFGAAVEPTGLPHDALHTAAVLWRALAELYGSWQWNAGRAPGAAARQLLNDAHGWSELADLEAEEYRQRYLAGRKTGAGE
jgi:hypothetical protein